MLLVGNGRLLTRGGQNRLVEDGCVAVEGNLIKEVGGTGELRPKYRDAEFIDAKGGLIMPGLINAHNHIYSAFAR
ncbi:MAG: chlorohydrolase, partial [Treponema sp.]|nr:chlorohydrolase [Treponema sp.]